MGAMIQAAQLTDVCFSYGKQEILVNVNASFDDSKFTVIIGKNGSGKSTLLRVIAGLLIPGNGLIHFFGKNLRDLSLSERAKTFGYLGQKHKAVFPFRVWQVVLTGRAGYVNYLPGKNDMEIAHKSLERMKILHLKDRNYSELSGGEQQLVMIARVLAQEPKILLLDEPSTHLDFSNQIRLMELLKSLTHENLAIVAVMHDPNLAFWFGDAFWFMRNKTLEQPGSDLKPWSADYLRTIYEQEFNTIPFEGKAMITPLMKKGLTQ